MPSLRTRHIAFAAILLSAPLLMGAQRIEAPLARADAHDRMAAVPTFRSESELVVVHVTVRDGAAPVDDLPREAFRLFDNSRPQTVSVFAHQDDPITIGLIIDVSGSMEALRARLSYAAAKFADTGRPDDELFAIVVGDRPHAVLPPDAPFTSDPHTLRTAIARAQHPGGLTALYDAIAAGLEYLERGSHARRALVVLSDGLDNASGITFEQVMMHTQASNAAVHAVGLVDPISLSRDPGHLRRLARATGGEAHFPTTNAAAIEALEAIGREIRSAYALGFVPTGSTHDGALHRLDVKVQSPGGRRLHVRAREGYLAGTR